MIRVFCGNDRAKIAREVKKILGDKYEVFDGENLRIEDLVNIFMGNSLFAERRKILIKDLTPVRKSGGESKPEVSRSEGSSDFYEEIAKYVGTSHEVIIWETNVSQKKSYKDFIKLKDVKVEKFDSKPIVDIRKVFDIYDTSLVDGKKAVRMLETVQDEEDPYMFFGLLTSQAIKKYEWKNGIKERKILKELSKLDIQMKTTTVEPWDLIKSFLLRAKKI